VSGVVARRFKAGARSDSSLCHLAPQGSPDSPPDSATSQAQTEKSTDMDKKHLKALTRSVDRANARRGDGDTPLPLFIRVAESNIYSGKPLHKALLKEIIFMRMQAVIDGDLRIPDNTPYGNKAKDWEGWCYASQKYLARRVGAKDHTYVCTVLGEICEVGYLKPRKFRSPKTGQWHKHYWADEAFIDQKIQELGVIVDEESDDTRDDSGLGAIGINQTAYLDKPNSQLGITKQSVGNNPTDLLGLSKSTVGINQTKYASVVRSEYVPERSHTASLSSTPPSPSAPGHTNESTAAAAQLKEKAKSNPKGLELESKQKTESKAAPTPCSDCGGDPGSPSGHKWGCANHPAQVSERARVNGKYQSRSRVMDKVMQGFDVSEI
jgi:hypothetical protein